MPDTPTSLVIAGALGRMGKTITALVAADETLSLAGVTERPEAAQQLSACPCVTGTDLDTVLPRTPGAVVIDFTTPEASLVNARKAAEHGNPIVMGATGFTPADQATLCTIAQKIPAFWAPNMSVGINVLLRLLPELIAQLGEGYDMELVELHHNRKKDAPSGTALHLARGMAQARNWNIDEVKTCCREGIIGERPAREIGIQTVRGGDVAGSHTLYFMGTGERIEITHHAQSRENFALGALRAARWLPRQQPGILYSMQDMLAMA